MNIEDLLKRSQYVLGKHDTLLPLWQDIADNFYVERADFTLKRSLNTDFAAHLTSSYPLMIRRELGDQISAMTRPRGEEWMAVTIEREDALTVAGKQKLEEITKIQFRAMYDRKSGFVRATKEGDHDYATFGQCVISADIDWKEMCLNFQTWHLRDVAWCVNASRQVCEIHRKWRPTIHELQQLFPGKLHGKMVDKARENPYCETECLRIVMESEYYLDRKEVKKKYVHITLDCENRHIMEMVQRDDIGHVIPRWQTVSGSQYAFSPATVIALPDARLIQSMALSMLEAGEMAVRPPLLAASDSIREDIQYFAGGITKADIDSDRQLKDVLAPIFQDKSGYAFGLELSRDTRDMIASAFYINKLSLPPSTGKETAYEISQRVQQYIRQALPLFEPLEEDYNGQLCDLTFDLLKSVRAFGPVDRFPRELLGKSVKFRFFNPLQDAISAKASTKWREAIALTAESMQIDPNLVGVLKPEIGLRESLEGNRTPMTWLSTEDEMTAYMMQKRQEQAQAQAMQQLGNVAAVAEQAGKANQALEGAT